MLHDSMQTTHDISLSSISALVELTAKKLIILIVTILMVKKMEF